MHVRRVTGAVCVLALLGIEFTIASCSNSADLGGSGGGGSSSMTGGGAIPGDGGPDDATTVGQVDGVNTALPVLPALTNVVGVEREDSVGIDFDPVDGATDYRVYPLPKDSDIKVNDDGSLTIKDAIYRCAGLRQTNDLPTNVNSTNEGMGPKPKDPTLAFAGQYAWGGQVLSEPTLGYVYKVAGTGRVPVYAVGVHPSGGEVGWRESRPKIYTTSSKTRESLLARAGRDDGIVFYVPSSASSSTQPVYHSETAMVVAGQGWTQYVDYYFGDADKNTHKTDTTPPVEAFQVMKASGKELVPLMATQYQPAQQHTELSAGKERYKRASGQGPTPLWHVEWAGITEPTTLVVEALASGCPYQGFLSPQKLSAPPHQTFYTLAELAASSKTGEVYLNGQYDLPGAEKDGIGLLSTPNSSPIPIARSFVRVKPQPHSKAEWDWYQGFNVGTSFGTVTEKPDPKFAQDQASTHFTSPIFDIGTYSLDKGTNGKFVLAFGQFQGQFWDAFDDTGQDVTGRLLFTAKQKAAVDSDASKFLHVTWSVDIVSTDRRYPQLIVSDQNIPVEDGFQNANSNFVLIQTILGPSMRLEVEAFHGLVAGKPWAVNNQAPDHAIIDYDNWNNGSNSNATLPPSPPIFEYAGMDEMVKYDAYLSKERLYVFVNGLPAGCMLNPKGDFAIDGPVTVTFADVLYHEGAPDEAVCSQVRPFAFLHEHQCTETKRHWDDLGFKSGVGAPSWDYEKFPCTDY